MVEKTKDSCFVGDLNIMPICKCGCGQECNKNFVRGHNFRYIKKNSGENFSMEYESAKAWLLDYFDRYNVNCRWEENNEQEPSEIIITAYKNGDILIGRGQSFSHATDMIIKKTGLPLLEAQ